MVKEGGSPNKLIGDNRASGKLKNRTRGVDADNGTSIEYDTAATTAPWTADSL